MKDEDPLPVPKTRSDPRMTFRGSIKGDLIFLAKEFGLHFGVLGVTLVVLWLLYRLSLLIERAVAR